MEIVIWSILMLLVGAAIGRIMTLNKTDGFLIVDRSDPDDGPYLFLELSKQVEAVVSKKYVVLRVKAKDFIPHK